MPCTLDEVRRRLRLAEAVAKRDVEELQRGFSGDERLDMWNRLRRAAMWYFEECSAELDPEVDRHWNGILRLAQLKIAASFRREGVYPDIVATFKPEEYEVLEAFESLKILDSLSVRELVEFIERREGKVYEVVKDYYERQFDLLERSWAPMIGSLAYAIASLYAGRRRKIEEAVIEYMRRRGLTGFIIEIEDAVRRMDEAARLVGDAERAIEDAEKAIEEGGRLDEVAGRLAELERRVEVLASSIAEAPGRLEQAVKAVAEALKVEAERIRAERERVEAALAALEVEREKLRSQAGAGGDGRLATREDVAAALSLAEKVRLRLESGFEVYDPLRGRRVKGGGWRSERVKSSLDGYLVDGYRLVRLEGLILRRPSMSVEVLAVYPRELEEEGLSRRPVGLEPLASMVSERISNGIYNILILLSPTGFDRQALSLVEGGRLPPLASRRVTLYLVDLGSMKVRFNSGDEAAVKNRGLAEPLLGEEKVARVVEWLASEEARRAAAAASPAKPLLLASDVAERLGLDRASVRAGFERAAERGLGRVVEAGGDVAFVYGG